MAGLGRRAPRAVGVGFFSFEQAPWGRALLYTLKGGGSPPSPPRGLFSVLTGLPSRWPYWENVA